MMYTTIRSLAVSLGIALAGALPLLPGPARAGEATTTWSLADVIAPLLPAVVNISVKQLIMPVAGPDGQMGRPRNTMSLGSGFIIDPTGVIVTNKHVIDNAYEITVLMQDGASYQATVMGGCACDIVLLKVAPDKPLPTERFGDSDSLRIGDPAVAIGNPLGLGGSVSAGIVSALNRDIRTSPFDDYIQTDAAINHGNSGGPLFNVKGEVVGINTAIISPTSGSVGIGFAIPANDANYVVDQIRRNGRVRIGWIGVSIQQVTPAIAQAEGMRDIWSSAIVTGVDHDGPSAGKIQEGDIIRKFADKNFNDIREFMRDVAIAPIGDTTTATILRDGAEMTVQLRVEEWPEDMKLVASASAGTVQFARADEPDFGLHLADLTDEARTKNKLGPDQKGALVTDVSPGSAASESDISPGDVILKVEHDDVATPADVQARLDKIRTQNKRFALVLFQSKDGPRWASLPLGATAQ
jgi:serine protease Do